MKKLKFFLIALFLLFSLVGCAEQKLLEQISLATLVGYDLGSEKEISTTAVMRQVNPEFQSNVEIMTTENKTSKGTRADMNRQTSKRIASGQMRVVLFSEELAKDGISHFVDALTTDSSISNSLYLAVVEGETKSLLQYQYENIEDIGQHIFKLMEQNIKGEQIISSTLHEVEHDNQSSGIDIAIPILTREEEFINISGVALFNEEKLVGELSAEDGFFLKLSRDNFTSGMYETTFKSEGLESLFMNNAPEEITVVLDTIKSDQKLKLINQQTPEFDLRIDLSARILEINGDINLGEPKNISKLEEAIGKHLSDELDRVITYCQEVDSDVFGFGEQYRSSVRNSELTYEKWHEIYKKAKVNVKVDFQIVRSGTMD